MLILTHSCPACLLRTFAHFSAPSSCQQGLLWKKHFSNTCCMLKWRCAQGAAITAALGGQFSAIISWLVATHVIYGKVTITTTAASGPSLAGNLVSNLFDCACKRGVSNRPKSSSPAHSVKLYF